MFSKLNRAEIMLRLILPVCISLLVHGNLNAAERREVLIYYANETAPDAAESENYSTIIQWLDSSPLPKARVIADNLRKETFLFQNVVDDEIAVIQKECCGTARVPVMIFTNRMAREGRCLTCDPRQSPECRSVPLMPFRHEHLIVNANPLSQSRMLRHAFEVTSDLYDPATHDFVLITKSHGNPDLALTVKLARKASELTRTSLLEHIANRCTGQPAAALGTTKEEYLQVLRQAGQHRNMRFPVVFMESCQGVFSESQTYALPENVEMLCSSGARYLEFRTLDYSTLLQGSDRETRFSTVLSRFLQPRYFSVSRCHPNFLSSGMPWFLPLLLWVLWISFRGFSPQHRTNSSSFESGSPSAIRSRDSKSSQPGSRKESYGLA